MADRPAELICSEVYDFMEWTIDNRIYNLPLQSDGDSMEAVEWTA